jgi:excisionase family DNA binding protein
MSKFQMNSEFMTTKQAAALIGLKPNTLEIWRLRGGGPRYIKFGRAVRYRQSDLETYIESQTRESTSQESA